MTQQRRRVIFGGIEYYNPVIPDLSMQGWVYKIRPVYFEGPVITDTRTEEPTEKSTVFDEQGQLHILFVLHLLEEFSNRIGQPVYVKNDDEDITPLPVFPVDQRDFRRIGINRIYIENEPGLFSGFQLKIVQKEYPEIVSVGKFGTTILYKPEYRDATEVGEIRAMNLFSL